MESTKETIDELVDTLGTHRVLQLIAASLEENDSPYSEMWKERADFIRTAAAQYRNFCAKQRDCWCAPRGEKQNDNANEER